MEHTAWVEVNGRLAKRRGVEAGHASVDHLAVIVAEADLTVTGRPDRTTAGDAVSAAERYVGELAGDARGADRRMPFASSRPRDGSAAVRCRVSLRRDDAERNDVGSGPVSGP